MNNPAENLSETTSSVADQISTPAERLQHRAKETWETVQHRTGEVMHDGVTYVRENPIPIIIGALALGMTLGLLGGRREPTFRERYIEEPLHESRGMLLGALLALGAMFRNFFRSTSSGAEHLGHKVSEMDFRGSVAPLSKAAKRVREKAGWL